MLKTSPQRWDLITKADWLLTDICFLALINTTEKITRCKIFWHYDEWIFAPSQRWLWDIMYFLAQAMPIVPTAFYGLTLTSSGLNILNICHNYKLLPSTSTVFFISQLSFKFCLQSTPPFYLLFSISHLKWFFSTQLNLSFWLQIPERLKYKTTWYL